MKKATVRLLLLFFLITLVLVSCKDKGSADKHRKNIKHSRESVTIHNGEEFSFKILDTEHYYFGEIEDSCYFFKIISTNDTEATGKYYPAGQAIWQDPVAFTISRHQGKYFFQTKSFSSEFKFSITIDTASVTGKVYSDLIGLKKKDLAFERYQEPTFQTYSSKRYQDSLFAVSKEADITYGKAKGFWTSYPIPHDHFGKMVTKTIAQTASPKELNLDMDIYFPKQDSIERRPLIVFIHGGAFYIGDKGDKTMTGWCEHFASTGYVTASINYRLGFRLSKGSIQRCGYHAIQDAHAAIRYLVANAAKYGIDTSAIFLAGTSAGAITALNTTYMTNNTRPPFIQERKWGKSVGRLESSGNKLHNKFKIKAMANMWGAVYDLSILQNHRTPLISFHGTADELVPYDEGFPFANIKGDLGEMLFDKMFGSKSIHEQMDSLHIRNEFYPIEGAKHAPYQDKGGALNHYYQFIQDKIQQFFYHELTLVGNIKRHTGDIQQYELQQSNLKFVTWKAEGGFIIKQEGNVVYVLWRNDEKRHTLTAAGRLQNDIPFRKTINVHK